MSDLPHCGKNRTWNIEAGRISHIWGAYAPSSLFPPSPPWRGVGGIERGCGAAKPPPHNPPFLLILILGGARSGKSRYAQQLAGELGERVLYVATATAGDEEMAERIARHRAERPSHWRTLEAPVRVGQALEEAIGDAEVVLLDCLTLLVSNLMMELGEEAREDVLEGRVEAELEAVLKACAAHRVTLIVVSNEVGMGLVPPYPMGRVYRDVLGKANQWLAARADRVVLMVAGIPVGVKGEGKS